MSGKKWCVYLPRFKGERFSIISLQVQFFGGTPTSDEDASPHARGGTANSTTPRSSPTFSSRSKPKRTIEPLQLPPSPYRTPTEPPSALKPQVVRSASMNEVDDMCVHVCMQSSHVISCGRSVALSQRRGRINSIVQQERLSFDSLDDNNAFLEQVQFFSSKSALNPLLAPALSLNHFLGELEPGLLHGAAATLYCAYCMDRSRYARCRMRV